MKTKARTFRPNDPSLRQYNGAVFSVLRPLTLRESRETYGSDAGKMYKIKFPDGKVYDAFEDEVMVDA